MNYVDTTLDRINGMLLDKGCGLTQDDLIDIGYVIATAIMSGIIDTTVIQDVEKWINLNQSGNI